MYPHSSYNLHRTVLECNTEIVRPFPSALVSTHSTHHPFHNHMCADWKKNPSTHIANIPLLYMHDQSAYAGAGRRCSIINMCSCKLNAQHSNRSTIRAQSIALCTLDKSRTTCVLSRNITWIYIVGYANAILFFAFIYMHTLTNPLQRLMFMVL